MADTKGKYSQLLNILLVIRDLHERFEAKTAKEIRALIRETQESETEVPIDIKHLYTLERMIADIRMSFEKAKYE